MTNPWQWWENDPPMKALWTVLVSVPLLVEKVIDLPLIDYEQQSLTILIQDAIKELKKLC